MLTRIVVLGAGAWGTAIANHLARQDNREVTLWFARSQRRAEVERARENHALLPGIRIPESIRLESGMDALARDWNLCIVAIPTAFLRATLDRIRPHLPSQTPLLSLTKGLEIGTFLRPSQILAEVLQAEQIAALSGPSHAEEVARNLPTTVVVASSNLDFAGKLQDLFSDDRFRVYTNLDLIGVELAGAVKNVLGIAAGISDGLGYGDNAKSALMTRGLVEMARFGVALGAEHQTFFGLAGLGDLVTTCISRHGRNRHVGERLALGESLEHVLLSMAQVAEGVNTTKSVHEKALRMSLDMPITAQIHAVLYEGKNPGEAVRELMLRRPKSESHR